MMNYDDDNVKMIKGFVEGIVYRNPENGYSVLDMSCDGELFTAVGMMATVCAGEELTMRGEWTVHQSFGRQFKVDTFERKLPKSASDMLRYLSSGTIKGVGPATAMRIVDRFGEKTFEVLENSPHELASIKGISEEKARDIGESFKKQFAVREVMIYLEKYGMTSSECLAAYKAFGANAIERINDNPYILCRECVGMSFLRVEEISKNFENAQKRPVLRERAGVVYIVKHNLGNGHTCLPRKKILTPACELLGCDEEEAEKIIDDLIEDKELVEKRLDGERFLFLPGIYNAEKNIADRIRVMLKFPAPKGRPVEEDIDEIEEKNGIQFEEKQREAILTAVRDGLLVLTGGPGTGKTTTLNGILELFEKRKLKVQLAAPTGRAAQRMSEVTGRPAKTIHRLLEVVWGDNDRQTFSRNMSNPLEADAVIVDELSMVDVQLFWGLLDALPLGCRLVLVGDSDQLPPVGPGNVLHDLIACGLLPVVKLTRVFRQALESLIVTNAHRIVEGKYPELGVTDNDFFFLKRENIFSAADTIVQLYSSRLPKAYGYNPTTDIQIICPSKKGELGTVSLNRALQKIMNPPSPDKDEFEFGARVYRQGDKVMQIKNNYDILWTKGRETSSGIFNGDIGTILTVNQNTRTMKIRFDERTAIYPFENLKELEHAYAVTVHKSQGSEFEAVIMPVLGVVPQLSYRNLLYTAVTRAKSKMLLVGSKEQVERMVDNYKVNLRYSALKYFLTEDE